MDEGERRVLTQLLRGVSARSVSVQPLPSVEADMARRQRPILTDEALLLPPWLDFDTARAAVAHAAAHLCHSVPHQPSRSLKPITQVLIASVEDARVERLLARRLPGVRPWFLPGLQGQAADGLSVEALLGRMGRALGDERWVDPNPWVNKARELFARAEAAHGLEAPAPFRALASVLANDLGQMRVRFDVRQFVPPFAYRDDHSWLWAHEATAMEPTTQPRPDAAGDAHVPQPPVAGPARQILYGEWDYRMHRMRADWCTVVESLHVIGAGAPRLPDYPWLNIGAARHNARAGRLRRQRQGDRLDLDACIRFVADLRSGGLPEGRVFERRGRHAEPAALVVLMDLSQSTLDAVPGGTLLALAQQAALALLVAGRAAGDRVAVHGFSSNTRHAVAYTRLVEADAPLDDAALHRIASAPARHSTRLGAAVRHATALLDGARAARKAVFVLTDGRPGDIDVHDSRYLAEDARHAVQEAAARGIDVLGLGTDAGAATELRRVFGRHARIAPTARHLPAELLALYARLRC